MHNAGVMQQSHGKISTSESELRRRGPAAKSPSPERRARACVVSGEPRVDLGVCEACVDEGTGDAGTSVSNTVLGVNRRRAAAGATGVGILVLAFVRKLPRDGKAPRCGAA
mmetsp:Transcript_95949/g.205860  ORF Transcript_95949/g.205860 Transcript_95949/m.205860 type:complete len:111 (-) Transcript_95949:7-339(-)